MQNLKLLIVEGNTEEENLNFNNAGCVPQSENFKQHINKIQPNSEVDITRPGDDKSISKIISSLEKYDGVVLTGSSLRIEDKSNEVKKHIEFAKTCFKHEKKIFAACWGLQITVTAAGGRCRVAPKGAHVGIAYDVELTNEGKKHQLFQSKPHKFTTPAFNYDEVEIPPNNAILLASNKINKFEALHFAVGNSEIWGLQYHPEIPYDYMIKLIKQRSKRLIEKNVFKNENEISRHLDLIKKAESKLSDDIRTLELKNWLNYLKN
jgi:GMP synthase (glutamine-hydrolysing)